MSRSLGGPNQLRTHPRSLALLGGVDAHQPHNLISTLLQAARATVTMSTWTLKLCKIMAQNLQSGLKGNCVNTVGVQLRLNNIVRSDAGINSGGDLVEPRFCPGSSKI